MAPFFIKRVIFEKSTAFIVIIRSLAISNFACTFKTHRIMNRLLTVLLTIIVLGCGTSCASDEPLRANDNETTSAYFGGKKVLIAYFSWSGTTQRMANHIQEITGGHLFRIEPVNPYPEDYTPCTEVALEEKNNNARPAIKDKVENWADYDIVFIGCPVWWWTTPMIIHTFCESYDFNGKTVVPFCTYAATYRDETLAEIVNITPDAAHLTGEGLTSSQINRDTIQTWIDKINEEYKEQRTSDIEPSTLTMTAPVPRDYFNQASQQGTVEVVNYDSKDYTGSMTETHKPAYVYLPYGYDSTKKYDIIYLIHGWTGTAEQYFGLSSWPQMKNLFDNMIQNGDCAPFIAVSPTWDKDNRAKDWGESTDEVAVFHNEYINDLIPAVESTYSTYAETTDEEGILASREHRAFGGFSLGSITTWYIFENAFDYQKWFLPMSGDNWHIRMFGGQYAPKETAEFLATVVDNSPYKDNFYVWYAVGTADSRFEQTDNQARAMMDIPETFNSSNFSYHQKEGGQHDFNSVWEFCYNALPFMFPGRNNSGIDNALSNGKTETTKAYNLNGMPVDLDMATNGIYIVRQGNSTKKIIKR